MGILTCLPENGWSFGRRTGTPCCVRAAEGRLCSSKQRHRLRGATPGMPLRGVPRSEKVALRRSHAVCLVHTAPLKRQRAEDGERVGAVGGGSGGGCEGGAGASCGCGLFCVSVVAVLTLTCVCAVIAQKYTHTQRCMSSWWDWGQLRGRCRVLVSVRRTVPELGEEWPRGWCGEGASSPR